MDFFGADDKFASTVQKTITTRKTVLVRPTPRPSATRIHSAEHVSVAGSNVQKLKTASRGGTPVGSPNKRRKVVVEEPVRKKVKVTKAPIKRATSPLTSSSSESEDDPLPPRLDSSPPQDEPSIVLTESSPITRQVFRPTLIHSGIADDASAGTYKGFIPSTKIVANGLAKYRPCESSCILSEYA